MVKNESKTGKKRKRVKLSKKSVKSFFSIFCRFLNKRTKDVRKLVNKIENCIIDVLNEYKIESYRDKKNIGIWVGDKNNSLKIAAIGIRVKKWIAYHGFALNVSNDLSRYNGIVPCGIKNRGITNLKKLGISNYNNIEKIITKKFLNIFL